MTIPSSTYRLQINRHFTLDEAAQLIGYLSELGVGAVYLSPVLQSVIGSDHGYDTTDVSRVDHDRGGGRTERLMTKCPAGRPWRDHRHRSEPPRYRPSASRTRHGGTSCDLAEDSPYASWFDIDWSRGRIADAGAG